VIAGGPSGDRNDRSSTSPVRFLAALGDAYRRSGRGAPIMDALGFHVYPRTNSDPPSRQYAWPSEAEQARNYADLIGILSCDPAVTDALVFHLVDERDLNRFHSRLLRIDGSERPSYSAVRDAISALPTCVTDPWSHAIGVAGAAALGPRAYPAKRAVFGISPFALEDAAAQAGIFRVRGPKGRIQPADAGRALALDRRRVGRVPAGRALLA
jgi:hypothetical protein